MNKKNFVMLLVLIFSIQFVSAEYVSNENYCDSVGDGIDFIAPCPHNHRIDGNWFKVKVYNVTKGLSYCENNTLVQPGCSYNIRGWLHPNVVGASISERLSSSKPTSSISKTTTTTFYDDDNNSEVPEFGTLGAILALMGASFLIYNKK